MQLRAMWCAVAIAACGGGGDDDGAGAIDGGAGTADAPPGAPDAAGSGGADAGPPVNPLDGIGSVELVDDGYMFLEGPTWRAADGVLLFSDIPANTIYQLEPPSTITTFRSPSGNSNGLDTDVDGLLLAAEHSNRRVSRTLGDGQLVDVATSYQGMSLNSPNDLAVRSDGTIYFTDPPYGIPAGESQELSFNGVFRVAPGGALTAEWEGALSSRPNGIALSPDEQVLYVADTAGPVRAYDVAGDGSLGNERVLTAAVTNADGMAIDTAGNLFVTTATGVKVFAPDGTEWGTISVPQQPANCAFGDGDARTLYITARTGLYRVRVVIPGIP